MLRKSDAAKLRVTGGLARLDALQQDSGGTARGHEVEHGVLQ